MKTFFGAHFPNVEKERKLPEKGITPEIVENWCDHALNLW